MSKKILIIILAIISLLAIMVDCYAGYALFLMTIMWLGVDFTILYFSSVLASLILFFFALIGLFKLKKWAYWVFFSMTLALHSFLVTEYLYFLSIKAIKSLGAGHILPMVSLFVFIVYFLLPPVRRMFK